MRLYKNSIIADVVIVSAFWWIILTLFSFLVQPLVAMVAIDDMPYRFYMWGLGIAAGMFAGWWLIWFSRTRTLGKVHPDKMYGIESTLGTVPLLAPPPPRAKKKEVLPIASPAIQAWMESTRQTYPACVDLFVAVWEILSAHRELPASPYRGGHGGRRLHEHSLACAEKALAMAPRWEYEGVFYRSRGKPRVQLLGMLNPEYRFDANDPVLPVLALAHDLGKVETYEMQPDGTVISHEMGSAGTKHARVSAQILARLPEWWRLEAADRRALARAIANYHDPGKIPCNVEGKPQDDRSASLMQFLIDVDITVGEEESNLPPLAEATAFSEAEANAIYEAFVELVTAEGRINGFGDPAKDAYFKIGQKHGGLYYVREDLLRNLILKSISVSMGAGPDVYNVTLQLLCKLREKSLLYVAQGVGSGELPIYTVDFFNTKTGEPVARWTHAVVFQVQTANRELYSLHGKKMFDSVARIVGYYPGREMLENGKPGLQGYVPLEQGMRRAAEPPPAQPRAHAGVEPSAQDREASSRPADEEVIKPVEGIAIVDPYLPRRPALKEKNLSSLDAAASAWEQRVVAAAQESGPGVSFNAQGKPKRQPLQADSLFKLRAAVRSQLLPVLCVVEGKTYIEREVLEATMPDIDIGDMITAGRLQALMLEGISAVAADFSIVDKQIENQKDRNKKRKERAHA